MKQLYTCANRATFPVLEEQPAQHRDELGKGGVQHCNRKIVLRYRQIFFPTSNITTDISVEKLDSKYFYMQLFTRI